MRCSSVSSILMMALLPMGCSTVTSYPHRGQPREGILYALPMNLVEVHAWSGRDEKRLEEIGKAQKKSAADLAALVKKLAELDTAISKAKGDDLKKLVAEKEAAETKKTQVEAEIQELAGDKLEAEELKHRVTMTQLPSIGDPDAVFVASPHHSILRRDDVDVSLAFDEKTGATSPVLRRVGLTADDRSGEVLLNVAKAYFSWSTGLPSTSKQVGPMAARASVVPTQKYDIVTVFNPASAASRANAKQVLGSVTGGAPGYSLVVRDVHGRDLDAPPAPAATAATTPGAVTSTTTTSTTTTLASGRSNRIRGVVYRQAKPYIIELSNNLGLAKAVQVELPNDGPVSVLPFRAGPFVLTTYEATFARGQLVQSKSNRPSEVEAFSLLPIRLFEEVSGAVTDAVSDVVQIELDTTPDLPESDGEEAPEAAGGA